MAIYSDVNHQDPKLDSLVYDIESIYQSFEMLVNTQIGQRAFLPEYGIDLGQFIFENFTSSNKEKLFYHISRAVERWEPRIKFNSSKSSIEMLDDQHQVNLFLVFEIIPLGSTEFVLETILNTRT